MTTLFPNSASFMKDVLPVKSKNDSVNVHLQIALRQIMDIVSTLSIHFNVDTTKNPIESHLNVLSLWYMQYFQHEKTQVISLSVWIRQYWNNPMLTWNSSQFMNISSINVDRNLVWVPDMCLYNT